MRLHFINSSALSSPVELVAELASVFDGIVILARSDWSRYASEDQLLLTMRDVDFLHAGSGYDALSAIQYLTFSWNFIDPSREVRSNGWKATKQFVVFRWDLVKELGGIDVGYQSLDASLMDLGYRALSSGARVVCDPAFNGLEPNLESLSSADQCRFVSKFFSRGALRFFRIMTGKFFVSLRRPLRMVPMDKAVESSLVGLRQRTIGSFTAIIPTLNRYDYLDKAIQSLLENSFPPSEILVIDQSPVKNRIPGYYDRFQNDGRVKVSFLDQPGQARSRNYGIAQASNDWIYFFDDDSICWKDCLMEHKYLLEHSASDVSTGLSLAPWKDTSYIHGNISFYRIADVLDTGNCFVHKKALETVGCIDLAFDRGPGADDDLGKRLYLEGYQITLNPKAIRTHYKASSGGLREHGAWWRNTSRLFDAYPPSTQVYMMRKYYPRDKWFGQILLFYLLSRKKVSFVSFILALILAPIKVTKAFMGARKLEQIREKE